MAVPESVIDRLPLLHLSQPRKADPVYMAYSMLAETVARELGSAARSEDEDDRKIITAYINLGQEVCNLGTGIHIGLARMIERVGRSGRIYYIRRSPNLEGAVYSAFVDHFTSPRYVRASGIDPRTYRILPENSFIREMIELLLQLRRQTDSAQDLDSRTAHEQFFNRYPITTIHAQIPPLPAEVKTGSIDVVYSTRLFSDLAEAKKEEVLWEIDRVLKKGGIFAARERPREIAEHEYYRQEALRDYRRLGLKELRFGAGWVIMTKLESRAYPGITIPQASGLGIVGHLVNLIDKDLKVGDNGDLRGNIHRLIVQKVSRGYLLQQGLLREFVVGFSGRWDRVAEAIVQKYDHHTQVDVPIATPAEDRRASYSLKDISDLTGERIQDVRRVLQDAGYISKRALKSRAGRVVADDMSFSYEVVAIIQDILKNDAARRRRNQH